MALNLSCGKCEAIRPFSGTPPACDVCGWVCTTHYDEPHEQQFKFDDFVPLIRLAFIVVLGFGAYFAWQQAHETGWLWHDELTIVTAKNWTAGEYKSCYELNSADMQEQPQIDCSSDAESGEPKRFKVRFYGQTYKEDLKDKAGFAWRCKRNEGTDPAFTCDEQKVIRFDQHK